MPYWAVHHIVGGQLRALGTVVADPLPLGLTAKDVGRSNQEGEVWDPILLGWTAGPVQKRQSLLDIVRAHPNYTGLRSADKPKVDDAIRAAGVSLGWAVEEPQPVA